MSKLKELIAELCPNGVEYKKFGECATIVRGASPRPIKNFITTESTGINWIKIGDVKQGDKYITSTAEKITKDGARKSRFVKQGDFILSNSMSFGRPYILKIDGCIHDGWLAISDFSNKYLSDFLYHLLNSNSCQYEMRKRASFGGAVQNLNADIVRELVLPVPPLPVQEEIVRILDSFTSLTAELQTKLQAELQARQKQYEYYRDQLLTFDVRGGGTSEVQWKTLGETCNMKAGRSISSSKISSVCDSNYRYACYGGNGLRGYVELQSHKGEFPIIGRQGALCGNVNYASGEFYATEHAVVVESKGKYLQRFLYHLLISMNLNQYKSQGAQPGLSVKRLEKLIVPIPSMEIQERIVNVLDNFDAICSDLNIGLPAEIEARQKQYEYYRDRLLSFPKLT
jgi:type I restriction enzyme S subunit